IACVRWCRFLVCAFPVPFRPTLREDAFEEFAGGFDIWIRFAPFFGEFAFDGGFEDGGFVALEIGLDALQVGDRFVETGELFFDLRDDLFLLFWRWNGYAYILYDTRIEIDLSDALSM